MPSADDSAEDEGAVAGGTGGQETAREPEAAADVTPVPEDITFIGNMNSGVLHYTWCPSVEKMKEHNKVFFREPLEEISDIYHPCGICMKGVEDPRKQHTEGDDLRATGEE